MLSKIVFIMSNEEYLKEELSVYAVESRGDCSFKESNRGGRLVDPGADHEVRARRVEHLGSDEQVQDHPLVAVKDLYAALWPSAQRHCDIHRRDIGTEYK